MRPIKFRYSFRRKDDGHIYEIIVPVGVLEDGHGEIFSMFQNNLWELIARDQFIDHTDKNNKDIYENDTIKFDKKEWYRSTTSNWESMPDHYEKVEFNFEYLAMRKNDFSKFCEVIDNPELLKNNQGEGNE